MKIVPVRKTVPHQLEDRRSAHTSVSCFITLWILWDLCYFIRLRGLWFSLDEGKNYSLLKLNNPFWGPI